jgi:4'-phosphopantetheinyl transferase
MATEEDRDGAPQAGPRLRILTLPLAGLDEASVAPLGAVLDAEERRRAARFLFPRNRVEFVAAHALTRAALAAALPGAAPAAFGFRPGPYGKPEALLPDGRPAPLSFNLSHTDGLVGVAVAATPGLRLGFDLEPLARRVTPEVARTVYRPEELAWLAAQPDEDSWRLGFLRLWTLKESFIKATGRGIGQGLSTFWFELDPEIAATPRFHLQPGTAEREEGWVFTQRLLPGGFLGAVGLHRPGAAEAAEPEVAWTALDLPGLLSSLGPPPPAAA